MSGGTSVQIATDPRHLDEAGGSAMRAGLACAAIGFVVAIVLSMVSGGDLGPGAGHEGGEAAGGADHGAHHGPLGYVTEWSWYRSYLVNFCFFLSISLGGIFAVLIHHLTKAGWSTVIRRLEEGIALNVILMAILAIPLLLPDGVTHLYKWANPDDGDALIQVKQGGDVMMKLRKLTL